MSIVIRPKPRVFHRTMPLVIIFGAYRRFELDPPLDAADLSTITESVGLAKASRMPLAFCRCVQHLQGSDTGVWLPGCRPRISDRVFDHIAGSAYGSATFVDVIKSVDDGEIFAIGPRGDSSMRETVTQANASGQTVQVVVPDHPLHKCSTKIGGQPFVAMMTSFSEAHSEVAFGDWKGAMWI